MKKKINVLHITLYLGTGGLETVIVDLCRNTNRSKFNVQVLCLIECDQKYKIRLLNEGVHVHLIKKNSRYDISFFKRIIKLLKNQKIDVIHAHMGCFFNAVLCGKLAGVPVSIYTAHGMALYKNLQARLEDNIASFLVNKIIAVSEEINKELQTLLPFSRKKIKTVYNCVNTNIYHNNHSTKEIKTIKESFQIPTKKIIIGSVGRLEKIKNYELLIRAFGLFRQKMRDMIHLVLIGKGSEKTNLERITRELGIESNITFLGAQYNIEKILPMFDIFVLSSITEGTSISLLEAQACGIPAVVTNVGGNNKIIRNGYNGFLCRNNDASDLCEKLLLLLEDKERYNKAKENSRKTVIDIFSLFSMVNSYENLYISLLQKAMY